MRGNAGSPKSRSHSPYTLRCSLPRNTFQLPIMCARTKPSSMMPVSAITHFLPTAERQNRTRKWPWGRGAGTGGPVYRASTSASSAPAF